MIFGANYFKTLFPDERVAKRVNKTKDFDYLVPDDITKTKIKNSYNGDKRLDVIVDSYLYDLINSYEDKQRFYFTLKASHLTFQKPKVKSCIYDLYLMSYYNLTIDVELYEKLYNHFVKVHNKVPHRSDLTMEVDEFFDNYVNSHYDHDWCHEIVKHKELPAYKWLQEPTQTTVNVSEQKFNNLSVEDKQWVVIEECQALALERFGEEKNFSKKQHFRYVQMLEAFIERLAPQWLTIYIINNLNFFIHYKEDYFSKLQNK